MPSLVFNTCCGCIELRSGCLIIGYLNLIGYLIALIFGALAITAGGVLASSDKEAFRKASNITFEDQKEAGTAILVVGVVFTLVFLALFTLTIVLLVGLHKNKRGHVGVYWKTCAVLLAISFIVIVAQSATHFVMSEFISRLLQTLLSLYFLLVIRSYYYKMDERKPAVYNTA